MMHNPRRTAPAFTFGVIADSHLEPEVDPASGSALPEIPRNNARNRAVVSALNEAKPDFVVHLGDLVHPVPALPGYRPAASITNTIFGGLGCPLHMTPGNHDIGDKAVLWMPAKTVSARWIDLYTSFFGHPFYSFDYGNHHFVLVNSPILNSGLSAEREQEAWLAADLHKNVGKRVFMFTHYPPFLLHPDEESHYDNIDEPVRSWFLSLIREYSVEALFCGHVHNFFYNRYGMTDIYALPSTSFVRSDYSELFRIGPGSEFGRNDVGKLGYFLVDVYDTAHRIRIQRTNGRTDSVVTGSAGETLVAVHATESASGAVGVHLRHPWAEIVDLPYNLQVDEFLRRRVRNDFPIQTIWELGIRRLRVPIGDLRDPAIRERMRALVSLGHEFTVFTVGAPNSEAVELITAHADLVGVWEVILPWSNLDAAVAAIRRVRNATKVKTFIAKLRSSASDLGTGPYPRYFLGHGLDLGESRLIADFLAIPHAREAADGFVFRIDWSEDAWLQIPTISRLAAEHGVEGAVTVCVSPASQREANQDDLAIGNRVAVAVFASLAVGDLQVFLDTFVDMDRGFYMRNGLVDRRYNFRAAGEIFRNLHAALAGIPAGMIFGQCQFDGGCAYFCANDHSFYALLLRSEPIEAIVPYARSLSIPAEFGESVRIRLVDLTSGKCKEHNRFSDHILSGFPRPALLVANRKS